jgi:hypothetical protein
MTIEEVPALGLCRPLSVLDHERVAASLVTLVDQRSYIVATHIFGWSLQLRPALYECVRTV